MCILPLIISAKITTHTFLDPNMLRQDMIQQDHMFLFQTRKVEKNPTVRERILAVVSMLDSYSSWRAWPRRYPALHVSTPSSRLCFRTACCLWPCGWSATVPPPGWALACTVGGVSVRRRLRDRQDIPLPQQTCAILRCQGIYCRSYYFRQQRFSGDESHDVQSVPVGTGKFRLHYSCIGILVMCRDRDILL